MRFDDAIRHSTFALDCSLRSRFVSHIVVAADNPSITPRPTIAFSKNVKASLAMNNMNKLLDERACSFFLLPGRSAAAELDFTFRP